LLRARKPPICALHLACTHGPIWEALVACSPGPGRVRGGLFAVGRRAVQRFPRRASRCRLSRVSSPAV